MNPIELVHICHHEAAHAVIIVLLGGSIDFVEFGDRVVYGHRVDAGVCSKGDRKMPLEQIAAINAAGVVSECMLGESNAVHLQTISKGDRADLQACLEKENGLFWTEEERDKLFARGVELCQSYFDDPKVFRAWNGLADVLYGLCEMGWRTIPGPVVETVIQEQFESLDDNLWQSQLTVLLHGSRQ